MRTASILLFAALATAAAAPVASATPIAYGDYYAPPPPPPPDPNPEHHLQPEAQVGMLLGTFGVGPISGPAYGLSLGAGVHLNRLSLRGEYDFMSVGETSYDPNNPDPVRGLVHRVGGNVRYAFAVLAKDRFPLRGDFWLELGAGREYLRWYGGGKLTRNDVSLGLGGQMSVRWGETKHKKVGVYYALKVIGAQRPDEKMLPPTCAGPCDAPTGPMPYDLGFFFDFAILFGR